MMILGSKRKKLILEQSTIEVPPIRGDDSEGGQGVQVLWLQACASRD
jgi:hypothetical protein